jgi:diaminopropionate ammonia-lyase
MATMINDACVTVDDRRAASAARDLRTLGVDAGPCGAATLAALPDLDAYLNPGSTVCLLITEGAAAGPL